MAEDWLGRWNDGRTGWHEDDGNAGLREFWDVNGGAVLVPLCGKSPDLVWLAGRGHEVVGIEMAEKAIHEFFAEQSLAYEELADELLPTYRAKDAPITLVCADYFEFSGGPFDALYDRGAIVAIDPAMRSSYVRHTDTLLRPGAPRLVITLEYDQTIVQGPPFALMADELSAYWPNLQRIASTDDLDTCPPKFIEAGLTEIYEVVWRSSG